jgi:UDP-N-acetylglucosamine 2-epimerase (non-hydrolysing)
MPIKVLSVFGTRPEAIKMAPVVKALEANPHTESKVCVTAQHREMLDQVLEVFNIQPDYDLDIMTSGQSLAEITTKALLGLEGVLKEDRPDLILVHGDTTTTFVGALAAFYHQVKVGHVEAGLRSFNKHEPYPEEMNRLLTGRLADFHFAPTELSKANLEKEGILSTDIFVTGNTAIDALSTTIHKNYYYKCKVLNELDFQNKKIITMTAHRRENLGEPLQNICLAIKQLVEKHRDIEIVYAVHKNPKVREVVNGILGNHPQIHLVEPLELTDMHNLLASSYLVLTDSGGIQEEVPSLGKPVLVLRNFTERPEGVRAGTLKIVGTEIENIMSKTEELLNSQESYNKMAQAKNPYGDGQASKRIVEAINYKYGILKDQPKPYESFIKKEC